MVGTKDIGKIFGLYVVNEGNVYHFLGDLFQLLVTEGYRPLFYERKSNEGSKTEIEKCSHLLNPTGLCQQNIF